MQTKGDNKKQLKQIPSIGRHSKCKQKMEDMSSRFTDVRGEDLVQLIEKNVVAIAVAHEVQASGSFVMSAKNHRRYI